MRNAKEMPKERKKNPLENEILPTVPPFTEKGEMN